MLTQALLIELDLSINFILYENLLKMEILISNKSRKKLVPAKELRDLTKSVIQALIKSCPFLNPQVSILFVDDKRMHKLNFEYRGIDKTTDVLSFPMLDNDELFLTREQPLMLGDIVISMEKSSEQAKENGHSIKKEIAFLLVHGFMHLIGHDHKESDERKEMFELQDEWMEEFEKMKII
jgi:probable rRNA maturation factor